MTIIMVATKPYQCLTLSVLILPPLLLTIYLFAAFPLPPAAVYVHPSLACLPSTSKSWTIYPEDFYPGGGYVTFPNGKIRYWLMGPENGKKLVLIHGLSIPAIIWKDVAPVLAVRGFRVLLYDLYGRGYSEAPQTTYDTNLYTTQLAHLMQYIKWEKANIVGLSMGGAIAAAFTSHFPHLVDEGVALIASTGLVESSDISRTAKFMSLPLVQTLTSSAPARIYIQRLTNQTGDQDHVESDVILEIVRLQSAHLPGYNAALSSSLRDGPIRGQSNAFKSKAFEDKKVLIIHGTEDSTVDPKYSPLIAALLPAGTQKKLITIEGAGHGLTVSHSKDVSDELSAFFGVNI